MKPKLTDAAQRALWARMARGPFRKRELVYIAKTAGANGPTVHRAVDAFVADLRARGAVYFSGAPGTGSWTLLPKEQRGGVPFKAVVDPPTLKAPTVVGPYDPAPEVEGSNSGLTELFAEHLWHDLGGGDSSYQLKSLPIMEQRAWREAAERALGVLFGIGFVGPAGRPREPHTGWTYKWLYEANTYEIADEDGGYVAMVANEEDVPMFLTAPDMAAAICELLAAFRLRGAIKKSDLDALARSLPTALPGYLSASLEIPPTPPSASGA